MMIELDFQHTHLIHEEEHGSHILATTTTFTCQPRQVLLRYLANTRE